MRIERTPPLRPAAARRDDRGAAADDRSFADALGAESAASPATHVVAAQAVDGLFALQEVSDALTGRRRAMARATSLLERLDELRLAILAGVLPRAQLDTLSRLAREAAPAVDDPKLAEILAEIELRAAVELAKLGQG